MPVIRVLMIDDDPVVRRTIARMLAPPDYEMTLAQDGLVGIEHYRQMGCDVVITDMIMPVKEGIETILELRVIAPSLPILAISVGRQSGSADLLKLSHRLGATGIHIIPGISRRYSVRGLPRKLTQGPLWVEPRRFLATDGWLQSAG